MKGLPKRSPALDNSAGAGYDLVANLLVGLGLGWVAQKLWPGIAPWGYGGGIVLGAASGLYQLFRSQGRPSPPKKPE